MRIVQADELEQDFANVKLREDEYWHGGDFKGNKVRGVLYCTKNLRMALSYVEMCQDRFGSGALHLIRVNLKNAAPWSVIEPLAKRVGVDIEKGYTPASTFDVNLFDEDCIFDLMSELKGMGYDHAVLKDVFFGVRDEDYAVVLFHGTPVQVLASYAIASGFDEIDRLDKVS